MPPAFALANPAANALAAAFLIFSFMGTGSSFLAYAIMAAKRGVSSELRGQKSLYYLGGLTEGTETILRSCSPACGRRCSRIALIFGLLCWLTTATRGRRADPALNAPREVLHLPLRSKWASKEPRVFVRFSRPNRYGPPTAIGAARTN